MASLVLGWPGEGLRPRFRADALAAKVPRRAWQQLSAEPSHRSGQPVADPDSLAELAAVRLVIANQAIVGCESALYIPAQAYRAATGDEIPDGAYRMEPL